MLVRAAAELLVERGYEKTTLAEIGKRAGYSGALVTQRFGSKDGLLWAVVQTMVIDYWKRDDIQPQEALTGVDALRHVIRALRASARRNPDSLHALYALIFEFSKPHSVFHERMQALHRDQRAAVERALRQGVEQGLIRSDVEPVDAAAVVVSGYRGAGFQWVLDRSFDYDGALAALDQVLAAGLTARPPVNASPRTN